MSECLHYNNGKFANEEEEIKYIMWRYGCNEVKAKSILLDTKREERYETNQKQC